MIKKPLARLAGAFVWIFWRVSAWFDWQIARECITALSAFIVKTEELIHSGAKPKDPYQEKRCPHGYKPEWDCPSCDANQRREGYE